MPQTRIEIEEIDNGRWVAEVEHGRVSRRVTLRADSFDDILSGVIDAYRAVVPVDPKVIPRGPDKPVDPALFPHIKKPVGKRGAAKMRDEADEDVLASLSPEGRQVVRAVREERVGHRG